MTSGDQQHWAKRLNQHTGAKAHWKSPTLKLYVRSPVVSLNFSTEKFTVTGFDRPKDTPMDSNIYCMRPNLELYAVLSRIQWIRLRRQGKLDKYLSERRNSADAVSLEINFRRPAACKTRIRLRDVA